MSLKVVELHHHAVRVPPTRMAAADARRFYTEVLGLGADDAPPARRASKAIRSMPDRRPRST